MIKIFDIRRIRLSSVYEILCRQKRLLVLLLTLSQLLNLCACGAPEVPTREWEVVSDMNSAYSKQIHSKCQEFVDANDLVGLAVGVFDNGQATFINFGSTDKDGSAITEHTQFEIASITKTFTSLLMAQMAADPNIRLDIHAKAEEFLPFDLPEMGGKSIELWHLATHTSGLSRMPTNYQENFNPYKDYDITKLIEYYETASLLAPPGEQYGYSNLGVGTLGVALTQIAGVDYDGGKGFEALLKERILSPLDMGETSISLTEEETTAMAQPHTAMGTIYPIWEFDALAACGALKSTTYDLTQYLAAAMGQISCADTLTAAFDECCKLHYSGKGSTIGLGFFVKKLSTGYTANWHDGATGGSRSMIIFCKETGQGVVILCNSAVPVYELGVELLETAQKATT